MGFRLFPSPCWNMKVGDVVIIQNVALQRNQWKLGLVTEVYCGSDGKVRRVKVKYINPSNGSPIEVDRPIQRLVIILAAEECASKESITVP